MRFFLSQLLLWGLIGYGFLAPVEKTMPEICNNGLDDDQDGFIDLNDADCLCPIEGPESLVPNHSFERFRCCPEMRSELNCASTWIQASAPTTDFIHTCGYLGWPGLEPPLPFPDGEGIVGYRNGRFIGGQTPQWKEYAGACLFAPLEAEQEYIMLFNIGFTNPRNSPPTKVALFGTSDCNNLPFGIENADLGCPTNGLGWIQLGEVEVSLEVAGWLTVQMRIRPEQDINAIAIGPSCDLITSDVDIYYFLDQLLLDEPEPFNYKITFTGLPCRDDYTLQLPNNSTFSYQWYKDGIALVGETSPNLLVQAGEGEYQAMVDDGISCRLTEPFDHQIPTFRTNVLEEVCPGDSVLFNEQLLSEGGIYLDTLESRAGCDSIVQLRIKILSEEADTLQAKIFRGETYRYDLYSFQETGEYEIRQPTIKGCERLILLDLSYFDIFIPNAFSPNFDGVNDVFTVFGGEDLERIIELKVFDRWGTLVFENRFFNPNIPAEGWNGRLNGEQLPQGVYIYQAIFRMNDGVERSLTGDILLMN